MHLNWRGKNCDLIQVMSDQEIFFQLFDHQPYSSVFVISDSHVWTLFGENFFKSCPIPIFQFILNTGEESKNIDNASKCWSYMASIGLDRQSLVVGFGGGMISDFAGFVASTFMRGIDLILIPTTLLGMVDAAIGGKTGVNLPRGKNLVGTFYPAKKILYKFSFLDTLSDREYKAGLAEVIKYGSACDDQFFLYLEEKIKEIRERNPIIIEEIVKKSCKIKLDIVEGDEREQGKRAVLNWGHTFAHAIETATDYSQYLHGEAVAIGMSCAAHFSHEIGLISPEVVARQDLLCQNIGLSVKLPEIPMDQMIHLMAGDKKAVAGKISLIVMRQIGEALKRDNIDPSLIVSALSKKKRQSC